MSQPPLSALVGLRVLDLSRVLAGPLCAQMLADHGASVIKVEPPDGDEARRFGPPLDERGEVAYFGALNRGKRSIAVDLSRPAGRAVLDTPAGRPMCWSKTSCPAPWRDGAWATRPRWRHATRG
jgi:crotonobetainyl-CoA:carnitine CoA-transferase CaiB-like acyl-CoA transferase